MMRKTHRRKTNKRNKTIKKRGGGIIKTVPVTAILMTHPIFREIIKLNPDFKPKGFKKQPGPQGFKLHKMNQAQRLDEPIKVEDSKKDPAYFTIVDGRHRFAKLVARGKKEIEVEIMNHINSINSNK